MQRTNNRENIIRIFRKFASMGFYNHNYNPIQVYKKIDMFCISRRSKLDMLAVFDTLRLLTLLGEVDTVKCIEMVYFSNLTQRLSRQEMGRRISKCALELFRDERTVYRKLEYARDLFEQIRENVGLIDEEN